MALVKFSSPVDSMRGTVGGVTFSANSKGAYAKQWVYPAPARSAAQQPGKVTVSQAGAVWLSLSGAQRTGWASFGALASNVRTNGLGVSYQLTGYESFVWVNRLYNPNASAWITTAPTGTRPTAIAGLSIAVHAAAPYLVVSYTSGELTGYYLAVYAVPFQNNTRTAVRRGRRLLTISGAPGLASTSLTSEVSNVFGIPVNGSKWSVWAKKLTSAYWPGVEASASAVVT